MSEVERAVREFLTEAESVYDEYDQGYVDADVALRRLEGEIDDLAAALDAASE